ncbi:hypothetical protein TIFTF001_024722 [Ficus carica]|uniref:Uncharacterized protein n=1 Tax=Ficus carica TaxID=3494 RepID=A0AA88AW29_FICCA|nr:hypothetical protein TIFTF001_024722 [Ficus carica]
MVGSMTNDVGVQEVKNHHKPSNGFNDQKTTQDVRFSSVDTLCSMTNRRTPTMGGLDPRTGYDRVPSW